MALKQRVTISDIAQRSGASRTTVSLVLRDRPGISEETRDRVLSAAQELGYERHSVIRRHHPPDVKTIAILFRARTRGFDDISLGVNPFYSWVLTGMESAARMRQMNLVFGTLAVDDENRIIDVPAHLLEQDLDGIAIIGAFEEQAVATLVGQRSTPVVLVDGPATPQRFDVIATDNVGGARRLVQHLAMQGHTRIAFVTLATSNPNFRQRELGYVDGMRETGCEPVFGRLVGYERPDGALHEIFRQDPHISALMVVNDAAAVGVVKAVRELGLDAPRTLSVVGFDDTDHATSVVPELTTMRVDKIGMGRHAIFQLDYRMRWPEGAQVTAVLAPKLVIRDSVAAPAARGDGLVSAPGGD
jgi:DNA-binding LacI/PurR family transcriptional regulator